MHKHRFLEKGRISRHDSTSVLTSTIFFFPAITLPLCVLVGKGFDSLLPPNGSGELLFLIVGQCLLLFCACIGIMSCYRFRIDEKGVTVQRLFYRRVFFWEDIQEIIIASRVTPDRTVECVIFCKEAQRSYIKPEPESIDFGKQKMSLCVDLDSVEYPADKLYAYINKQRFLRFADENGIILKSTDKDTKTGDGFHDPKLKKGKKTGDGSVSSKKSQLPSGKNLQ